MNKHLFALFYNDLTLMAKNCTPDRTGTISDKDLIHRINSVLRARSGEKFLLFDQNHHIDCTIIKIDRTLHLKLGTYTKNHCIQPTITCILPLLKREACEEALYGLTELGVQNIRLVTTEKTQRAWGGQKEFERMIRIIHAAAEQSKNYSFPHLEPICTLAECVKTLPTSINNRFFFDPEGIAFRTCVDGYINDGKQECIIMAGPEGDLTQNEKDFLTQQHRFTKVALTPTILRAQQAILVATGALRSLLHTAPQ